MKKKKRLRRVLWWFIIVCLLAILPSPNYYFNSIPKSEGLTLPPKYELSPPPPYPINQGGKTIPQISAEGVLIKDLISGVVLYAKNEKIRLAPASTTKIITALVALDTFNTEDILQAKSIIKEGRVMGLVPDEKISVEALLYGILVHSANDAAWVLAENYPGGLDKFVEKMNEKAKSLNLENTHFTNPVGFDDPNHYTTPTDLAKLAIAGLNNKFITKLVSTRSITVSDASYTYFHELKNVNELLGKIPGVAGVKTGYTDIAGEILVTEVKKNDRSILFVLLKSRDRFGETAQLIDWVFNNYVWNNILIPTP